MAPNAATSGAAPPKKRLNGFKRWTKSFSMCKIDPITHSIRFPFRFDLIIAARKMRKRREGKMIETLEGHEAGINCMALNVDESILVTGSEDCTARVWMIAEDDDEEDFEDKCLGVLE